MVSLHDSRCHLGRYVLHTNELVWVFRLRSRGSGIRDTSTSLVRLELQRGFRKETETL